MTQVSVIMPCYNDGLYIEEAVASLQAQTYTSWELLIVDDGSEDEATLQVLHKLAQQPGIRLLHAAHGGPAAARNLGIEQAAGTYILPLDADDRIAPTYLEKAVQVLESTPAVGIVYCHAQLFGEKSGPWELPDYNLRAMLQDNIIFVTAMFRRADWQRAGGFCTQLLAGMEDYDFWLSLLELGCEVVQLQEVLFDYRIKPQSRTTGFQHSQENIRQTYHMLYRRHTALYEKYRELYDLAMRDTMLELIWQRDALQREKETMQIELTHLRQLCSRPLWRRALDRLRRLV